MKRIEIEATKVADEVFNTSTKIAFNTHLERIKSGIPKFWYKNKIEYLRQVQLKLDMKYEKHKEKCNRNPCSFDQHYLNLFNNIDEMRAGFQAKNILYKYWPHITGTIIALVAVLRFLGLEPSRTLQKQDNNSIIENSIQEEVESQIISNDSSEIKIENTKNILNNKGKIGTVIQNSNGEINVNNNFRKDTTDFENK